MQYLRLFESFKTLYHIIDSSDDLNKGLYDTYPISGREIEKINRLLKSWCDNKSCYDIEYRTNSNEDVYAIDITIGGSIFGHTAYIEKLDDDYFLINYHPRGVHTFAYRNNRTVESYYLYFKCDQIEGVLNFLTDARDRKFN